MNWDGLHCPSWTGGVAATSIKVAKHRQGADGVVVQMFCSSLNNHPVCADSGCFAIFSFWHSHPSCPGGAMGLIPIRSQLHRPLLQWELRCNRKEFLLDRPYSGESHSFTFSLVSKTVPPGPRSAFRLRRQ